MREADAKEKAIEKEIKRLFGDSCQVDIKKNGRYMSEEEQEDKKRRAKERKRLKKHKKRFAKRRK